MTPRLLLLTIITPVFRFTQNMDFVYCTIEQSGFDFYVETVNFLYAESKKIGENLIEK